MTAGSSSLAPLEKSFGLNRLRRWLEGLLIVQILARGSESEHLIGQSILYPQSKSWFHLILLISDHRGRLYLRPVTSIRRVRTYRQQAAGGRRYHDGGGAGESTYPYHPGPRWRYPRPSSGAVGGSLRGLD